VEGVPPRPPGRYGEQVTREDLKGLRRWVIVAGVWAVAATAVALIALLDSSDSDARKEADEAAGRVTRTERKLGRRLDALETRLEGLPRSEDVSKLQGRLARAETDASKAAESARSADEKVGELEDRVQALEDAADTDAAGGTDTDATPDQP
jgi:hypothetical protein